jgi:putative transposase
MADKVVPMDVRTMVVVWPNDAPRGAVTRFCEEYAVSRSWFYEIRKRARNEGELSALQPRPRRLTVRHRQAIAVEVEELAVRIRKSLKDQGWDYGPRTVRHRLQELGVAAPAASTLARVFTRRGMVTPQPQKRPHATLRRFEFAMVHECWQMDAFDWVLADGSQCAIFQVEDDRSRMLIASLAATAETAAAAIAVTDKGIAAYQVPCLFLTDNGSAFNQTRRGWSSQLVTHLRNLGCRPITGRPGHPQTQGKDERVHQSLQRWLRARPAAASLAELQALLDQFDDRYNNHRPHQSLGMRTPAQARADGPIAIAPIPAELEPRPPREQVRARRRKVTSNGNLNLTNATIQMGAEYAGTQMTVLTSGNTANLFDAHGHHVRSVILEPNKRYYSNGRPRGRRPKQKPSTLT